MQEPRGEGPRLYNLSPRIVECFPGKHHELFKAIDKAKAYIREEADHRLKNLDASNPQDYFDVFLVKMLEHVFLSPTGASRSFTPSRTKSSPGAPTDTHRTQYRRDPDHGSQGVRWDGRWVQGVFAPVGPIPGDRPALSLR
ncbi:cytochrome P450 2C9-like [Salmo trutta]|uniref:cytochrome P450 2C9-like n=1 Tax=Salmo trutta TaxID=8032 RepID=UPI00113039BA|nr:cytochrome P450 2C9-like [Salmo trutta]